jgi:hypothetical protein
VPALARATALGLPAPAWVPWRRASSRPRGYSALRERAPAEHAYLDWHAFIQAKHGLFLWEAFVTEKAKATTHVDDAYVAVRCFVDSLPEPPRANAIDEPSVLSLIGACLAWSDWSDGEELLGTRCLVLRAAAV